MHTLSYILFGIGLVFAIFNVIAVIKSTKADNTATGLTLPFMFFCAAAVCHFLTK